MQLEIVTALQILLSIRVRRIVAESPDGSFGLLPHHIDFVSQVAPGILVYEDMQGKERYAVVNSGTLVKCGDLVRIATHSALLGDDLDMLETQLREKFSKQDQAERVARSALARLEAQMVRHFLKPEGAS
jgi:F-type H+-transporting ATPase subunit epsilon